MIKESDKAAYEANPEKFRDKATKFRRNNPERVLANNARVRANRAGIPLDHTKGQRHDGSPTLDKIRPELGYVPGNVRVVSWLANAVKRDLTPEQLLTFARNIGPYLR